MDNNCQGPVQGFKIFWHPADELPRASHPNFVVPLKRVAMIQMKPHMTTTSDNLIDLTLQSDVNVILMVKSICNISKFIHYLIVN